MNTTACKRLFSLGCGFTPVALCCRDPAKPYETTGFGGERTLKPGPPAQLTPLGKRLLGLELW